MIDLDELNIAIMGLGYVGLPLALAFGEKYPTLGFDIASARTKTLQQKIDTNGEVTEKNFSEAKYLQFTDNIDDTKHCNVYIITVPTPIDTQCCPDLQPLKAISQMLGKQVLQPGDIVIYESTVYPGAIEQECVPILAGSANLIYNQDFFVGYSPERINPGDKQHTVKTIVKVTSGSTEETAEFVDNLYSKIIDAGTHKVSSIQVAEAAKVIENTQRDLNIALINELAIIFNKLKIDTEEVLQAAATKWNFIKFFPGLVGGHCIGVDPYYLTYRAQDIGYHPEVILAGRRINDGMGRYIVSEVVKKMLEYKIQVKDANVIIMGFAFKEDCADFRNTKVIDIFYELQEYGINVDIYDPLVDISQVEQNYDIKLLNKFPQHEDKYDAIILAVAHREFKELSLDNILSLAKDVHVLYDVKYLLSKEQVDARL